MDKQRHWLKQFRKAAGLTIEQAAQKCGVNWRTWANWEAGTTTPADNWNSVIELFPHARQNAVEDLLGKAV